MSQKPKTDQHTQSEKFKEAARDLGCDEDEARFEDALRKIAKHKPPSGDSDLPADESEVKYLPKPK